ncbi:hypothetical protein ACWDG9_17385 [Streptomyces sp. NPDC001073]
MGHQQWWTPAQASMNTETDQFGHTLTWKRLPREASHALVFEATCTNRGATVSIGSGWSACATVRDARREPRSGPGTAALTKVEQAYRSEEFREMLVEDGQALQDAGITLERPPRPFRSPLAAEGTCRATSQDGYTRIRRLNKRGTRSLTEYGPAEWHVGTRPGAGFTNPFSDDDVLYA